MIYLLQHLAVVLSLALFHIVGPVPIDLGVHDGALAPCATPAHCARADWPTQQRSGDTPQSALESLIPVIEAMGGTKVVELAEGYLHATATSSLFGFVDDLELYADTQHGILQARSVSRLGDSDLGVNSKRLEILRKALIPAPKVSNQLVANVLGANSDFVQQAGVDGCLWAGFGVSAADFKPSNN